MAKKDETLVNEEVELDLWSNDMMNDILEEENKKKAELEKKEEELNVDLTSDEELFSWVEIEKKEVKEDKVVDADEEIEWLEEDIDYSSEDDEESVNMLDLDVKKWTSQRVWDTIKTVTKKWKVTYSIDVTENTYKMFFKLKELLIEQAKKVWDISADINNDKIIATMLLAMLEEFSPDEN